MDKKIALISGITGQDGSFLAEFLIEKGYEVHGILRRSSSFNTGRIEHLYLDEWVRDMKKNRLVNLHYGDMTDSSSLIRIIQQVQPDEIYNLAAARIAQGYQDKLYLGNLNSLRDWGYAKDYVECMWLILQHDTPEDFVIATGEYHTVRDFTTLAFKETGVELRWEGEGVNEKGIDTKTGKVLVEVDPKYFRPAEVEQLLGDPTKARTLLGWNPRKTSFEELVKIMVTHDMAFVKKLYMRAQMDSENTPPRTC